MNWARITKSSSFKNLKGQDIKGQLLLTLRDLRTLRQNPKIDRFCRKLERDYDNTWRRY